MPTLAQQDRQLASINRAEAQYKEDKDLDKLILFWEKLWSSGGLKFRGVKWTFRLVDLYCKSKQYDKAWRMLNEFTISRPDYLTNTRKWQIKILKKEKKDYSHIQDLLDKGL